jgi:hypothetical protein
MTVRRFAVTISALTLASALVSAQGAPQQGTVVMRGRAPVSAEILKVKLPRPAEADLPSGLHLMVLEDRRVPMVTFQLQIPGAGGYFDPADQPGLAQITAAMMREGTATRTTSQISEMLETKAAGVTVSAGLSGLTATLSGSSRRRSSTATRPARRRVSSSSDRCRGSSRTSCFRA